ncbi:MAG: MogA/MoaB family molybdenum cofactor biosynthesis protein [Pyrinomonadaceae bacterium]
MNPFRAIAITVSDRCSRGEQEDLSGPVLIAALRESGAEIVESLVVSDDLEPLTDTLRALTRRPEIDLIITAGGTGFGPRDNTPEATRAVIDREAPGLAEAMRAANPKAMLSRGVCGICLDTLIVNLPGSPAGVKESFAVIKPVLSHAIRLIGGDTRH